MRSIRFGLIVIAVCGLIVLAAGVRVAIWANQAGVLKVQQEAVSDQLLVLRQTMTTMLELENAERGYIFTGNETYLERSDRAQRDLTERLGNLEHAFRGDKAFGPDAAELLHLARDKQSEATQSIRLRGSGDQQAALAAAASGQDLVAAFRAHVDSLNDRLRPLVGELDDEQTLKFRNIYVLAAITVPLVSLLIVVAIGSLSVSIQRLRAKEQEEARAAMHDALTGLPNRRYLDEWLHMAIASARRTGVRLLLLYFDLDGFKQVNDRLGHEAGDRVLQVTATRLRRALRVSDFVSRLGGDEFVAILRETPSPPALAMLVGRLQAELSKAPIPELPDGAVSASIGTAWYPADGDTVETLLAAGDRAMYEVKQTRPATRGHRLEIVAGTPDRVQSAAE